MGKTPNLKKVSHSKHSRAAKRASSPSLNIDKSLLSLPRPASPPSNNPTGKTYSATHHGFNGSGISKRKTNKKESRNQRLRREKGLMRAEINLDVLGNKLEKSRGKARVVKERSRGWDEVDGKVKRGKGARQQRVDAMEEDGWEDESEEDERDGGVGATKGTVEGDVGLGHGQEPEKAELKDEIT